MQYNLPWKFLRTPPIFPTASKKSPAADLSAVPATQEWSRWKARPAKSPVERWSDASGTMLRVLAAVVALGALLYFLLRR